MIRSLLFTCSVLLSVSVLSQEPDKALIRVRYTFTHLYDTTQKEKPRTENMLLIAGKNASLYTSYDRINRTLNIQKQLQEQIKANAGGPQTIKIEAKTAGPVSEQDIYFFADEQKLIIKERIFNNYLIEEPAASINWEVLKDTASFSGIHCQKASARFKGRNWTVWFAPELPFQFGPWKLNGLPGLILEAYDEQKEVVFRFAGTESVQQEAAEAARPSEMSPVKVNVFGIDTETNLGPEIRLPADAIKTNSKELEKLRKAWEDDPQGFANAQMAARGIKGRVNTNNMSRAVQKQGKPTINNPIELPEGK